MRFLRRLFPGEPAAPAARPVPQRAGHPEFCIRLDHRERAGGLEAALRARLEERYPLRVETLAVGDVIVGDTLGIERKRVDDFVASLRDGRLFDQAARLADRWPERLLIVEGEFTREVLGGMGARAIRGAMAAMLLDWRIPHIRTRSVEESADWTIAIADRIQRRRHRRIARPKGTAEQQSADSVVVAMLLGIPGIGGARAEAIAARYPTMEALLAASVADLAGIDGIGPGTAAVIVKALRG
jgi:Fanconi anemia group M protein